MRLDYYLPTYDFVEKHSIVINAPAQQVLDATRSLNLSKSLIVWALFGVRSGIVQAANYLNPKRNTEKPSRFGLSIGELISDSGFIYLEEVPNKEIILGLIGKFWTPSLGILKDLNSDDFMRFNRVGYAKSVVNFYITPNSNTSVTLSTETRVLCLGPKAKLGFSFYWMFIRPFSGLIRHMMLELTKEEAEHGRGYDEDIEIV